MWQSWHGDEIADMIQAQTSTMSFDKLFDKLWKR